MRSEIVADESWANLSASEVGLETLHEIFSQPWVELPGMCILQAGVRELTEILRTPAFTQVSLYQRR